MRAETYTFTLIEENGVKKAIMQGPGCLNAVINYSEWPPELLVAAQHICRERLRGLHFDEEGRAPGCGGPQMIHEKEPAPYEKAVQ